MMLWIGPGELSLGAFMALSYAGSIAIGVVSWHCLEKPALRLKRYLPQRKAESKALALTPAVPKG